MNVIVLLLAISSTFAADLCESLCSDITLKDFREKCVFTCRTRWDTGPLIRVTGPFTKKIYSMTFGQVPDLVDQTADVICGQEAKRRTGHEFLREPNTGYTYYSFYDCGGN